MTDPIGCTVRDGIACVTLNNPPLNVVTLALTAALGDTLERIAVDDAIRAVVLTGSGQRAFCAGSDIGEFGDMMTPGAVLDRKLLRQNAIFNRLDGFPKPTIAAVRGLLLGGGLEIALCCDLIVVEEDSRIGLPEIKLGVFPSSGGPVRATRRIGEGRARQLMLLGDPIDAATALQWGLVDRVAPVGGASSVAMALAATLATRPALAIDLCKQAIGYAFDRPAGEAIERALLLSDRAFSGPEVREGVRAFFAKTPADFTAIPHRRPD